MLEALAKGDKIVTTGGLIVEIIKVEDGFFKIKHTDGGESRLVKTFVASNWED